MVLRDKLLQESWVDPTTLTTFNGRVVYMCFVYIYGLVFLFFGVDFWLDVF